MARDPHTAAWALAFAADAFAAEGNEDHASGTVSLWGSDAWGGVVGAISHSTQFSVGLRVRF